VPGNGQGARPGESMVKLDWSLWCARHLEPYREQWPKGAPVAMMRLFDAAVKMPAVADAAGNDAANLTTALRRFRPLCCFVGQAVMDAIYAETAPSAE
jgi:hypothetical protein